MSFECGIVGLPNVGKSTLFNTLTSANVAAENFPFCTVDPNRGIVDVPDSRLDQIAELVRPERIVPTTVTFVDIAGLVKGAAQGEGLGNQFLSHIRSVDAIAHVVRCFDDENITHVMGSVDPVRDVEIIDLELCLSDLETVRKRIEKIERIAKSGNAEAKDELSKLQNVIGLLEKGIPLRRNLESLKGIDLQSYVTAKPILYVANIAESQVKKPDAATLAWIEKLEEFAKKDQAEVVVLSASLEYQLSQLEGADRELFFQEYGIEEPGLNRFIRKAYELLGLITYFTVGPRELRAWTIQKGQTAVEAAGKIHSDFAKGFIRAETIHFEDYIRCGGEKGAKEKGLQRAEGRDYIVQDGDVLYFRFNV